MSYNSIVMIARRTIKFNYDIAIMTTLFVVSQSSKSSVKLEIDN